MRLKEIKQQTPNARLKDAKSAISRKFASSFKPVMLTEDWCSHLLKLEQVLLPHRKKNLEFYV